ncbi:DoxX-like protein [Actinomadura pelletieri DSM 43383]|uniref:DoxX-like protein n=1 Tax=Actinomadura pelletieri DSM 43383 TaxID=1120940 RepID=A0A495QAJ4_9ACTN|nr:DoxX family protein [Actinomadura pelletieri]RKS68336.1 DoxX-like protein [Actinomadura pelletieri DSM 43383]
MEIAFIVVTVVAAAASAYSTVNHFVRPEWIVRNFTGYGVPLAWLPPLGVLKAAGVAGLLIGLAYRPVAIVAATGLVVFYLGAIVTVIRARFYSHIPYPLPFLLTAAGSLALGAVS